MATKTTKTTKTPAPTEDDLADIYWVNPWGLVWNMPLTARDTDWLDADVPTVQIQCFWRWLKNLPYNDGSASKINTPGATSRDDIIAQIRVMYHALRPAEVRGYGKKEVKMEDPDAGFWTPERAAAEAALTPAERAAEAEADRARLNAEHAALRAKNVPRLLAARADPASVRPDVLAWLEYRYGRAADDVARPAAVLLAFSPEEVAEANRLAEAAAARVVAGGDDDDDEDQDNDSDDEDHDNDSDDEDHDNDSDDDE